MKPRAATGSTRWRPMSSARARPVLPEAMDSMPRERQPAQLHGKHHGQHQPQPEAGDGVERQRADRKQAVAGAARPRAGDDAERRAEAERQRRGAAHQQQRVRQPLADHVEDRPREGDGPAEVEMGQRPQIGRKAGQRRLVEPPALAQQLDQPGIAASRHDIGIDRVAAGRLQQAEGADDRPAAAPGWRRGGGGAGGSGRGARGVPRAGAIDREALCSFAPPSVLPDISPTWGEIGRLATLGARL